MPHVPGCLGCEIACQRAVPGGIVHQTARWIVHRSAEGATASGS